uniref:F-box domain-containing protein n=1 Tax=Strongyloides papillosus TaxID=174720 RepID=A0A0N5BQE4_STREA
MDFVSLPDQFKLPILKKLNWRDLNNLKLVCRKPKVEYLKIFYDENKIFGADYSPMYFEIIEGHMVPHNINFNDDREYEIFLKDKDFTELKRLVFENVISGEIIDVKNNRLFNGNIRLFPHYSISLSNRTSKILQIMISRFYELRIPYNGNLLRKESLRKFGLFEKDGSHLIIKKIAIDNITGDPMLEYGNILTASSRHISIQIADQLCELSFLDFKNRCGTEGFILGIDWEGESGVLEENFYRELYDKIKLSINSVKDLDITDYPRLVSLNCSKCSRKHTNFIDYQKNIFIGIS